MLFSRALASFAGALLVAACAGLRETVPVPASVPVSAMAAFEGPTQAMNGYWRSNGYGLLMGIDGKNLTFHNLTGEVCIPFTEDDSSFVDFVDAYRLDEAQRILHVGASLEQHTYQFLREDGLPDRCLTPPPNTPEGNFAAFESFMGAHYAFFDLYGVDWNARVEAARGGLRHEMTETELFDLFSSMLAGINDAHLTLVGEIGGERRVYDPVQGPTEGAVIRQGAAAGLTSREAKRAMRKAVWEEGIPQDVLNGAGTVAGNGRIHYGLAAKDVGYFAMYTVGGYSEAGFDDPLADIEIVNSALDAALNEFIAAGVGAVIVDASQNHGGYDFISREIASRFAASPVNIYDKRPADAERPYHTQLVLTPSDRVRFTGPVYLLTTDITVSGGETLTLSMKPLANVIQVGTTTRGALSDILEKRLPNGWMLGLSNEIYADANGAVWEGRGIAPEVLIDVFPVDDINGGHAKAIAELVRLFKSKP
ncbi:S41 family peptidase [Hyphomonas sp.]|uniref:S41 family peptidase n=1 Tax=Hyphomonas sp. TaxID=87 RepID=UPI001D94D79C|nr:S41 family peptidase [Hyphomonas sp.]MBU3919405.1 S41 family peptidase [Alphaproteobacteria bacterium]MBU4062743.1 S41 family peptidase [Alphaproteobacteria bacterium]MBU4163662.1 S41 family peptidase [Alphaproteobacteria bacterium]